MEHQDTKRKAAIPFLHPDEVEANPLRWRGPTDHSYWVVPGQILAGVYPGHREDEEQHRHVLARILSAGVTTFVCLQPKSELAIFRPYRDIANELFCGNQKQELESGSGTELQFLHFPIPDSSVVEDEQLLGLLDEVRSCLRLLASGT